MLKSEFVKIKVSSGFKQNYSELGYNLNSDEVDFKISDLKESSNQRVNVICDICSKEYNIQYCKYIKNIKRNGFYSCKECGLKKRSELMTTNNLSLNPESQKKKKETFIKIYGVDNPSKSDLIKNKKKETCLNNYGVENGLKLRSKVKEGMINKYGVEHALQSDHIKDKMYEKLIIKYGVNNISKLLDVKIKKEETCLKNNGVKNPSQNKEISKKQMISYKSNYFEKHGVYHPMKRKDIFEKMLISAYKIVYYNEELFAQGSYELDFLNYCEEKGIINLISNGPSVEYELNDKKHIYHSDFFIEKYNLIVEVKSSYTYNYNLEKNLAKEKYSKINGYNFIFLIDKDYEFFNKILNIK
jgi:hypothetical protein